MRIILCGLHTYMTIMGHISKQKKIRTEGTGGLIVEQPTTLLASTHVYVYTDV